MSSQTKEKLWHTFCRQHYLHKHKVWRQVRCQVKKNLEPKNQKSKDRDTGMEGKDADWEVVLQPVPAGPASAQAVEKRLPTT